MSKNRVFSNIKLAKENLKSYAESIGEPCCIYEVHYGVNNCHREYVFRKVSELIDLSSKRIKLIHEPQEKKKVEKALPVKFDVPLAVGMNPNVFTSNLFFEVCAR